VRLIFLSLLLVVIVVCAHPIGPIASVYEKLNPHLYRLGLNLSMHPVTHDMFPEEVSNIYQYNIRVLYQTDDEVKPVPFRRLSLYRFRIPAMLFAGARLRRSNTAAYRYAICHELDRLEGPGNGFMIQVDVDDEIVHPYGLNMFHPCLQRNR